MLLYHSVIFPFIQCDVRRINLSYNLDFKAKRRELGYGIIFCVIEDASDICVFVENNSYYIVDCNIQQKEDVVYVFFLNIKLLLKREVFNNQRLQRQMSFFLVSMHFSFKYLL